ncbi:hypothetical protein [Flavobacterium sp. C3NV]|uniref:WapI family immunity protein n=1 Tax=Flavobacterium sp. C3NV TaxID=3393358 RepID=UPI00398FDBB9
MMLIQQDRKFLLEIKGYEFDKSTFSEDLNWLNIQIWAHDDFNKWNAKGAFLRTNELKQLYLWFKGIEDRKNEVDRIDFIENELSFQYFKDENRICINLDFDFHPKKERYVYGKDEEYKLFFDLNFINIKKLIQDLEQLILKFPER